MKLHKFIYSLLGTRERRIRLRKKRWILTLHERMDTLPEHLKYEYFLHLDKPWPKKRKGNEIKY